MTISKRTIDILATTGRQLSGIADMTGLLDNALKGSGESPHGYIYAAEICQADITGNEVAYNPFLIVGSHTIRITADRIAAAYARRIGEPIQYARIRLYGQL